MICRNKDKAEEARADIVKETGNKVQYGKSFWKKIKTPSVKLPRGAIIDFSKCHDRRSMSTSWTCLRPRKCGSLLKALRKSTRPSMCW